MKENKTQFFISGKPIDLSKIGTITGESLKMPIDWEEATRPHTISFDCEVPKETAEFFKKQMEELEAEEKKVLEKYTQIAKKNAEYYIKVMEYTPNGEERKLILESVIMHSLCRGWNDCFDYNVKHEKK